MGKFKILGRSLRRLRRRPYIFWLLLRVLF